MCLLMRLLCYKVMLLTCLIIAFNAKGLVTLVLYFSRLQCFVFVYKRHYYALGIRELFEHSMKKFNEYILVYKYVFPSMVKPYTT